jgi:hypothetical protein
MDGTFSNRQANLSSDPSQLAVKGDAPELTSPDSTARLGQKFYCSFALEHLFALKQGMRQKRNTGQRRRIFLAMIVAISVGPIALLWHRSMRPALSWCQQGHPLAWPDRSYKEQDVVDRVDISRLSKPLRQLYEDSCSGAAAGRKASDYEEALAEANTVQSDRLVGKNSTIYRFLRLPFSTPFADILSHTLKLEVYVCNRCRLIVYTVVGDNRF